MVRGLGIFREFFSGMDRRKAEGEDVDQDDIEKHKKDVFRIIPTLSEDMRFPLPPKMRTDLRLFLDSIETELPGKELFKAMKLPRLNAEELVGKIRNIFQL